MYIAVRTAHCIVIFSLGQITPRAQRKGPSVLIMCPTRELALQIRDECKKYSYHELKCLCIYGGGNRREQMKLCAEGGGSKDAFWRENEGIWGDWKHEYILQGQTAMAGH